MINIKKIGLTALAGSLVAVSAYAGELSVSGGAKMSYTADTGNEDVQDDGNRFGLQKSIGFTGSGELDNGHTVSLEHYMAATGALSSTILTYDMGDMGKLKYAEVSQSLGMEIIDDLTPTADEEIWNGLDTGGTSNETPVGRASLGNTGFNYTYSAMDGVKVDVGYSPKTSSGSVDDGGNSGAGALRSSSSIAVQYTGIEGANLFFGTGEAGAATTDSDVDIYGFTYAFGPITVGAQRTEIDYTAASSDLETDMFGISFAVNDNLSISYGQSETSKEGSTVEQELSGFSIGYSMGGMTVKAHQNKGEKLANTAANESEHTEIAISFAF
jgi:outer membrane protein OmpU